MSNGTIMEKGKSGMKTLSTMGNTIIPPEILTLKEQELKIVKEQVETIIETNKLSHPMTRATISEICKHMNLRLTQLQCIEAMLHCRGPSMEAAPEEDYDFDKLVRWL